MRRLAQSNSRFIANAMPRPASRALTRLIPFLALVPAFVLIACVEESNNPVVFDQELESTTFENRLFTPVIIFRDGAPIDTLEARREARYPINRKGVVRHGWRILAPRIGGERLGEEPSADLGIQYAINERYEITWTSVPGKTIFTPRISNLSVYDVQLFVNYREQDEFLSDQIILSNTNTSLDHAPYFYWHSSSNVVLDRLGTSGAYRFSRLDTNFQGDPELDIDYDAHYDEGGVTEPLIIP